MHCAYLHVQPVAVLVLAGHRNAVQEHCKLRVGADDAGQPPPNWARESVIQWAQVTRPRIAYPNSTAGLKMAEEEPIIVT